MTRSRRSLVIAAVAISVAVAAAVGVLVVGTHRQTSPVASGASPTAIGEAIFQSGIGPEGAPVPRPSVRAEAA